MEKIPTPNIDPPPNLISDMWTDVNFMQLARLCSIPPYELHLSYRFHLLNSCIEHLHIN